MFDIGCEQHGTYEAIEQVGAFDLIQKTRSINDI